MDFTKMTGYEFEDFIADMFRQKGFIVEQTDYSGDGGIDLVAIYNKPLFSGKYIIQCKNYTNNLVGQPEVRDLYGVVASENANKGILITPSDYTEQAYTFAKGKNIELINGPLLSQLIEPGSFDSDSSVPFTENTEFNKTRYDYLKSRIENDPTEFSTYYQLYEFLRKYIENGAQDICKNGLIQEVLSVVQRGKERCFKAKRKKLYRDMCDLYIVQILIAIGEIGQATQLLLEIGNNNEYFYFKNPPRLMPLVVEATHFNPKREVKMFEPISSNLYSAFYHMGYTKGCEIIKKHVPIILTRDDYHRGYISYPDPKSDGSDTWVDRYNIFINQETEDNFYFCAETYYSHRSSGVKEEIILFELKKSLSTKWLRETYYRKTDTELINEVEEVFCQHGIDI